jgi:uncharacterized protein involved in propanediol utilization
MNYMITTRNRTGLSAPGPLGALVVPGRAIQVSHWGEVVQGPVHHHGRVVTGLITLPRRDRRSTAEFSPRACGCEVADVDVQPAHAEKARRAALAALRLGGRAGLAGELRVRNNIRTGCGSGSSTADVIAAIRATASAIGATIPAAVVQRMAWEIEGASDPLALLGDDRTVIYGSRTGELIRVQPYPLPAMVCLGFNADPRSAVLTETLVGREGYTRKEVRDFAGIVARAELGIITGRVEHVARAATESARMNQRRVRTPRFEKLVELVTEAGGLGLSVSHSGTVAAALFHPLTGDLSRRIGTLADRLAALGCDDIGVFTAPR